MKNLPIKRYEYGIKKTTVLNARFVGYTCLEQDVLYKGYSGDISNGDYILFGNIGGYSLVDKPPFIMPDCPMIAIKSENIKLIKRRETFEDIFNVFEFEE